MVEGRDWKEGAGIKILGGLRLVVDCLEMSLKGGISPETLFSGIIHVSDQ